MSSSDEEEQFRLRKRQAAALVGQWYAETYCSKRPCRTSSLQGLRWVQELIEGHPIRIYQNLRMSLPIFNKLKQVLLSSGRIDRTKNMELDEMLAIFLFTVSHSSKNRDAQERFQRSGETISRNVSVDFNQIYKH